MPHIGPWTVFVLVFLTRLAVGSPSSSSSSYPRYDYGFDVEARLARRQSEQQPLIVRGATQGGGGARVAVRKEIGQLQQDDDLWTLYLLGLSMMQFTNQTSPMSWYGIAGIHGVPYPVWAGVEPYPGNEHAGYCTHVSILFPTWHRPYLALYEQVLYGLIQEIAGYWPEGPERDQYQAVAAKFRIPYWDWAANPPAGQSVLPFSVGGSPYVDVAGPNGVQRIANPLYTFEFNPLNSSAFIEAPWDEWTTTIRAPTIMDADAQSNNSMVALILDQNLASNQQRLYNLFSNYQSYVSFSNEGLYFNKSNASSYDSLESLHDTIHTLAGGFQGHMAYIPFSAFDPIFFLHHAMVDRVFAIWQVLYPKSWLVPQATVIATATSNVGQIEDETTPLTPFFADGNANFWTSDMVRDHTTFGYTYADIAGSNRSQIIATINQFYGSSSPASLNINAQLSSPQRRTRTNARSIRGGPVQSRWSTHASSPSRRGADMMVPHEELANGKVLNGNLYQEWVANVHVDKQALNGSFSVHFFLGGDPPANPHAWAFAPNLVGTMAIFASVTTNPPSSSTSGRTRAIVSGTVPLTASLVDKVAEGVLPALTTEWARPYLVHNLHYRILAAGGRAVNATSVPSLGIKIAGFVAEAPSSEHGLPVWGGMVSQFVLV